MLMRFWLHELLQLLRLFAAAIRFGGTKHNHIMGYSNRTVDRTNSN